MQLLFIAAIALLTSCGTSRAPNSDPAAQAWYGRTVDRVAEMNLEAEHSFATGKSDHAAALIEKAEPLVTKLVSVPHPTLAAIEAASDLDDLYGRMLLSNRHYAWARLQFQKNLARWKHRDPQTPETARRLKQAESAIDECDRHLD